MVNKEIIIRKNAYFDSVTLMSISADIKGLEGVIDSVVSMATPMNKELLKRVNLFSDEVDKCDEYDLVIAFSHDESVTKEAILDYLDNALNGQNENAAGEKTDVVYKSIKAAKKDNDNANMAIISVPGEHAKREVMEALKQGLNVMLFSDNVTLEDEIELKKYAVEHELLVMGPDCGTAYINGTGLCFANRVNDGVIGIAGASGTGMQELMVLVDKYGGGISNAIGVGGRDLREEVGGLMMMEALKMLNADEKTRVILMVSKVPAQSVSEKLLKLIKSDINKPVVIYYATDMTFSNEENIYYAKSLKEAAITAVNISKNIYSDVEELDAFERKNIQGKYIRGLYCGGTLCAEAYYFLRNHINDVRSNIASHDEEKVKDAFANEGNMLLDMGDDLFTQGRPHPMIDPTLRLDRIMECATDKETKVILLDFELGYGSHEDPVGATIDTILKAHKAAEEIGKTLIFVTYVQGTGKDFQNKFQSEKLLKEAGCIVCESNIDAVVKAYEMIG